MKTNIFLRFRDDEKGTATIESLLWMPLFFYLFILITDVSFIFFGKSEALRIIQDGNRLFAIGSITDYETEAETGASIQTRLRVIAPNATASTDWVAGTSNAIFETTGTLPITDLMAVGSIPGFVSGSVSITAQHYKEY